MRREQYPIKNCAPGLLLTPETDEERNLTVIERAAAEAALRGAGLSDGPVWKQIAEARVRQRDLNGYGAYVRLEAFPESSEGDPRLTEQGFAESSIKVPWRESPLYCLLLLQRAGVIGDFEFFPIDGENWSSAEIERLLFGSVTNAVIESR